MYIWTIYVTTLYMVYAWRIQVGHMYAHVYISEVREMCRLVLPPQQEIVSFRSCVRVGEAKL